MDSCDYVVIHYLFEVQSETSEGEWDWVTFDTGTAYEERIGVYTPPEAE